MDATKKRDRPIWEKHLLTSTDIAALCEVDVKTIHNWADRAALPHFRTPGKHLRFQVADVVTFLRKHGYPVPPELDRAAGVTPAGAPIARFAVVLAREDNTPEGSATIDKLLAGYERRMPLKLKLYGEGTPFALVQRVTYTSEDGHITLTGHGEVVSPVILGGAPVAAEALHASPKAL